MTINLDNAVVVLSCAALGLLLLPLTGTAAKVARYIVGGGLLLLAVVKAVSALTVSA